MNTTVASVTSLAEQTGRELKSRDAVIWHRHVVLGIPQQALAEEFGVSQPRISKLVKRAEQRIVESVRETAESHKLRSSRRLDHVYAEASAAWRRSQQDQQSQSETDSDAAGRSTTKTKRSTSGDPRYLDAMLKAVSGQRALWGTDAPSRTEHDVRSVAAHVRLQSMPHEKRHALANAARLIESEASRIDGPPLDDLDEPDETTEPHT